MGAFIEQVQKSNKINNNILTLKQQRQKEKERKVLLKNKLYEEIDNVFYSKGYENACKYYNYIENIDDLIIELGKNTQECLFVNENFNIVLNKIKKRYLENEKQVENDKILAMRDILDKEIQKEKVAKNIANTMHLFLKVIKWGTYISLGIIFIPFILIYYMFR